MPRPGHFNPGKDPISIVEETEWAPLLSLSDAESLFLTGIRSPDRPVHSELLYRIRYAGPHNDCRASVRKEQSSYRQTNKRTFLESRESAKAN
jgi:chorismate synthase